MCSHYICIQILKTFSALPPELLQNVGKLLFFLTCWNCSQHCWKYNEKAVRRFWNTESCISEELIQTEVDSQLMWCLLLLFPAVKLAQVIRWSVPISFNHLVIMTVFAHGQWLNICFISLWLSLTPTGQHNVLRKQLLSQSLCFFIFFPSRFLSFSLSCFFSTLSSFCVSLLSYHTAANFSLPT